VCVVKKLELVHSNIEVVHDTNVVVCTVVLCGQYVGVRGCSI
jgi:hypothetical protein